MAKLFAVRSNHNDRIGATPHEDLFGYEPCVFRDRQKAERHACWLRAAALSDDFWDEDNVPKYFVEEVTEQDLYPAEEIAD